MTTSPAFGERFALARFRDGGVVVDLANGNYFQINASASIVCESLCSSDDVDAARSRICGELDVSPADAARMIDDVTRLLDAPPMRGDIQGPYHFYEHGDEYELRHGTRCVLRVGRDSNIRLAQLEPPPSQGQLELYLRALAPKLLFQRGVTILHASACVASSRVIAFAGLSGAGKTTTALAFASSGARLISEDLVVLSGEKTGHIFTDGEAVAHGWARQLAALIAAAPERPVPSSGLADVLAGPPLRLDQILVLHRSRRRGIDFATRTLAAPEALTTLLTHDFLGAADASSWRRYLDAAVALVTSVDIRETSSPAGIENLSPAAVRYTSNLTS